jgi:hypothetical protein
MKQYMLVVFLILGLSNVHSQTFQWQRNYAGASNFNDYIHEIDDDDRGNIYGVGYTNTPFHDWLIIKYNSAGVQQWVRTVNGPANHNDEANAVVCPTPNEIYVTGYVSGTSTGLDMLTIKYDSNGVEQWRHVGGNTIFGERGLDIKVDPNGFIYATKWWNEAAGANHHYLLKYSATGNLLWERMGDPAMSSITHTVATLGNGDVYVGGTNFARPEFLVERYNSAGTKLWTGTFGNPPYSSVQSFAMGVDANGNAYLAGSADTSGGIRGWLIVKFSSGNGSVQWFKRYPGNRFGGLGGYASDMYVDPAGNLYATGYIDNNNTFADCLTVKLREDGTQLWSHLYATSSNNDEGKKCWLSNFGDLYVLGRGGNNTLLIRYNASTGQPVLTELYSNLSFGSETDIISDQFGNIWFSGTNYNGFNNDAAIVKYLQAPTSVEPVSHVVPDEFRLMQNYPNPFNPSTRIRFSVASRNGRGGESENVSLKVFDVLGKEVATLVNEKLNAGSYEARFDASGLASGVYLYKLQAGSFSSTKKMLLVR